MRSVFFLNILLFFFESFFPGLLTAHFFCLVQVTVPKNHGFKLFAVMVFTLSRLKIDDSGETRFDAVRFTVPGQVGGFVTIRCTIPG